jgi:NAD(P)-dependent dehydrogenase (short-subunit alcohol dehydrogenase family)
VTDAPVVLVTGATGSLGRVVAARFRDEGSRLALVGRDQERLDALGADLGLAPGAWLPVAGELADVASARTIVAAVEARFDRVDVLVHLVGGWSGGTPVVDLDPGEVRMMLDQHLWTTLHIVQAVVPGMIARGSGRVLAVSSSFAAAPGPKGAGYALAKAAQEVLLRSLARETAASGVTANMVVVRAIDVGHEREADPSSKRASWTTPEEIADALAFLASPAAAAITGARIPLDGR